jgi:ABC-type polysaccharide/polyol phosphate export permease
VSVAHTVGDRHVGLARYWELIVTLAARTLKVRYRGSLLGVFWSLANPLLMTGVYTLIFGTAFARYYNGSVPDYTLAVFVALAVLAFFTASTTQALQSVVSGGGLLNKVELPFSVFPLSYVAANAFQLAIGALPLLIVVTALRTHSAAHVIALAGPIVGLVLTSIGFSLLTSALFVFFRDLPYIYEVFSFILYMTSPVFYPASLVPQGVRVWVGFNPLATIVEATRAIALRAGPIPLDGVFAPIGAGLIATAVGAIVFAILRSDFMDLL